MPIARGTRYRAIAVLLLLSLGLAGALASPRKVKVREDVAIVDTNLGRFIFRFYHEESPKSVEAFKRLARGGYYDGTLFDTVLPGLMIEGGDPQTRETARKPDVDFEPMEIETNDLKHRAGTVSLAHERDEERSQSEFFICLQEISYFDGKYTIIGEVIEGLEVVTAISNVPRNLKRAPLFPVKIRRIAVEQHEYMKEVR